VKPVIGISAHQILVGEGEVEAFHHAVNSAYIKAVRKAGGVPVLLPVIDADTDVGALLERVDGLVMTGGGDVDPENYGEAPDPMTSRVDATRDVHDIAFCRTAVERDIPTLAICRGSQILNVALGGTLVQHLDLHFDVARYNEVVHDVDLEPSSTVARWTGATRIGVNSLHHQAVATAGSETKVVAYATDGTIEAVEVAGKRVVGVQWHPELIRHRPEHLALFVSLVRLASE
jgi:putative glutamine amidotransferase